jgi:hypothetical protein
MATLDYQSPSTKVRTGCSGAMFVSFGTLLLAGGIAALVQDFVWFAQMDSPNFNWGPGQYIYNIMESIAFWGSILLALGMTSLIIGLRRIRQQPQGISV